jgi:hypothetical protein
MKHQMTHVNCTRDPDEEEKYAQTLHAALKFKSGLQIFSVFL